MAQTKENTERTAPAIRWTASEFLAHEKSFGWYARMVVASLALGALAYLVTRDPVSVGVVIVAGLILAVYGSHQPRQLEYEIGRRGIGIAGKYRSYEEFRSFSIVPEGAVSSLVFMPLKRFAVPLTIYYSPADEDKILTILHDYLPLEEHGRDRTDNLMRRIGF